MRVLGISGSLRRDSHNTALLRAAGERLPAGAELEVYEGLAEIPPYSEDIDPYGGEYDGYEFVYPKGGPNMVSEIVPQPEITYTALRAPVAEQVIEPASEPVNPAPIEEPIVEAPEPVELPRTATPLPLFAVGGLTSLLAGLGLGLLRRRVG